MMNRQSARKSSFVNRKFHTPGGEIGSHLAYNQKSRGQNLPRRPLPRCITSSAPVSDTGCLGANPSEAANFHKEQTLNSFMTDILNKSIVLVLNRNWQAINIRTPQEAF